MAVNPLIPPLTPRDDANTSHLQDGAEGDGVHNMNFAIAIEPNELAISAAGGGDGDGGGLQPFGPHQEMFMQHDEMDEPMQNPTDMEANELEEEVHRAVNEMFALLVEYNANIRSQISELEQASSHGGIDDVE